MDNIGPMERIFTGTNYGGDPISPTDDQNIYQAEVLRRINDARSYNLEVLSPDREEADRYYKGVAPTIGGAEDPIYDSTNDVDRSTIVANETRDTILAIMPSLVRIFTAREHPVEYMPNTQADVPMAEQATDYVSYVFWEDNPGFLILHSILKDALNKRTGIVRWWTDDNEEVTTQNYTSMTDEQLQFIMSQHDNVEILKQKSYIDPDSAAPAAIDPNLPQAYPTMMGGAPVNDPAMMGGSQPGMPPDPTASLQLPPQPTYLHDVTIRITKRSPLQKIEAVPPEEFRIDSLAKSVKDSNIVGHERVVTTSDLVKLGYAYEDVREWGSSSPTIDYNEEVQLRNVGPQTYSYPDNSLNYGDWWMKIDADGDGIDELHHICTVEDQIVMDEPCTHIPIAMFCPDPEPHTAIGHSINELVQDIQKIKTNVLRSTLDNLAQVINPRMIVNESLTNMDDALSDAVGQPIRVKGPGAIEYVVTPFVGEQTMAVMGYLDQIKQSRTGISEASKGLDPKALQSTAVKGVEMVITGAQERIELIARILAETGMKDMFRGLLIEVINNPNKDRVIKLRGEWVSVMPDTFDPTMKVRVNPALGRGSDTDKFQMLAQIAAKQEMVISTLGPNNPIVTYANWMNTMFDMLAIAGIKNADRYFSTPTPDQMATFGQASAKPDPAMVLANNEVEKTRAKAVETIAKNQASATKLAVDDDFRRDKLAVDATIAAAQAGLDGQKIVQQYDTKAIDHGAKLASDHMDRQHDMDMQETQNDAALEQAKAAAANQGGGGGGTPSA